MIIDAKIDYKNKKFIVLNDNNSVEEKDLKQPYFYVIIEKNKVPILQRILNQEDVWLEKDWKEPIIYKNGKYEIDNNFEVYKVYTKSHIQIPKISENIKKYGFRISASNVKYSVRQSFDYDIHYFDTIPLYHAFDFEIIEKLRKLKILVIDIESIKSKPVLASVYWYKPLEEIRKDDIMSFWLPNEKDNLQKVINEASIIAGHNIIGYDIPMLKRMELNLDTFKKLIFDTTLVLTVHGNSLGVGSSKTLLDVAAILSKDANITEEELKIKKESGGKIEKLTRENLLKYNRNDVVITSKILNVIFPFIATVSALTQIPTTEVAILPSGIIAEYFLLRYNELLNLVPEYRSINIDLTGDKTWSKTTKYVFKNVLQTDIKMMYPSFVHYFKVDPTLIDNQIEEKRFISSANSLWSNLKFNRKAGIGIVYSAVERLITVRNYSKKLKKSNPLYEPLDKGIKSILNALSYGATAKQSGLAILGNPFTPAFIFYGTLNAQWDTIKTLQTKEINVFYSDTDSFFVELQNCNEKEDCDKKKEEIVNTINEILNKYGLEADVEGVWDSMFIYSEKNYYAKRGDIIVIKGSALLNLDRMFLPVCVKLTDLLKIDDKEERRQKVNELIENSKFEDLFINGHQQLWRLLAKDVQSFKRLDDKKERYIRVLTQWNELPFITLKKAKGGHLYNAKTAPIFKLFLNNIQEVDLTDKNPFEILELKFLKIDDTMRGLKIKYGVGDLLIFDDSLYSLTNKQLWYIIQNGSKKLQIPSFYEAKYNAPYLGVLTGLKADNEIKKVEVDEDVLRSVVLAYTKKILTDRGIL